MRCCCVAARIRSHQQCACARADRGHHEPSWGILGCCCVAARIRVPPTVRMCTRTLGAIMIHLGASGAIVELYWGHLGANLVHVGEKCCGDGLRWQIPVDVEQKKGWGAIGVPPSGPETYACTCAPLAPPLPHTDAPTTRGTPPPGPGGGGKGEG